MAAFLTTCLAACGGAVSSAPVPRHLEQPRAVASSPPPVDPTTPDAPFREKPPVASETLALRLPAIQERKLKNGLRVLFVERHDLPVVAVRVVSKTGAGDDGSVPPLTFALMIEMLELGTAHFDANAISDGFDAIGAEHGTTVGWDSAGASVKTIGTEVDRALDLLTETTLHPTFPKGELQKLKLRRIGRLALDEKSPRWLADNARDVALFGRNNPYGKTFSGRKADIEKVTREDVVRAYDRLFGVDNAALVVAGDVSPDAFLPKLEERFGQWKPRKRPVVIRAEPVESKARVILVDKPRAPQSFVYLAEPGSTFSDPDRIPLTVMNAIFGGLFSSRINLNLREKNAYSYGVGSAMWLPHGQGLFYAGGAVHTAETGPAVAELISEAEKMLSAPVTADELADAKEYLRLGMPARFETARDATAAAGELLIYGLPLDDFEVRCAKIDRVTAADVTRVAKARIHPDNLKVVIVGDMATVRPQIEKLNLGPIETRDAYGDRVQ